MLIVVGLLLPAAFAAPVIENWNTLAYPSVALASIPQTAGVSVAPSTAFIPTVQQQLPSTAALQPFAMPGGQFQMPVPVTLPSTVFPNQPSLAALPIDSNADNDDAPIDPKSASTQSDQTNANNQTQQSNEIIDLSNDMQIPQVSIVMWVIADQSVTQDLANVYTHALSILKTNMPSVTIGLERFSARDINLDLGHVTLDDFAQWKSRRTDEAKDMPAILMTNRHVMCGTPGCMSHSSIGLGDECNNVGALHAGTERSVEQVGSSLAHVIGHLLGMRHDLDYPECAQEKALMRRDDGVVGDRFSRCSLVAAYQYILRNRKCFHQKSE